jgi:hypothetical protein
LVMYIVPAVNESLAEAVPDPDLATVNVVEPHPLLETDESVPRVKDGKTTSTVSDTFITTFRVNENETEEAVAVEGVAIVSWLEVTIGVGCTMAGDVTTGVMAVSATIDWIVTAVLELRSAFCAYLGVVTPVRMLTAHMVSAAKSAVAVVYVMVAVDVSEFVGATVKVDEPHPNVDGVANVPSTKLGMTTAIVSPIFNTPLRPNVRMKADWVAVRDSTRSIARVVKADVTTAVEESIVVATIFVALLRVNAAVRVLRSAA